MQKRCCILILLIGLLSIPNVNASTSSNYLDNFWNYLTGKFIYFTGRGIDCGFTYKECPAGTTGSKTSCANPVISEAYQCNPEQVCNTYPYACNPNSSCDKDGKNCVTTWSTCYSTSCSTVYKTCYRDVCGKCNPPEPSCAAICSPNWQCKIWGSCVNGQQTRDC
ncbi:TPA: hypothetical protein H1016_05685, partial [archaeon]|nr:hypothetical protein [Candidatus Naiadarchaeum limnaeum]